MANDTVFMKIVRGEIPADIVYRDELVTAFRDLHPQRRCTCSSSPTT